MFHSAADYTSEYHGIDLLWRNLEKDQTVEGGLAIFTNYMCVFKVMQ